MGREGHLGSAAVWLCYDFFYRQYLFFMSNGKNRNLFFFNMINDAVITVNEFPELVVFNLRNNSSDFRR